MLFDLLSRFTDRLSIGFVSLDVSNVIISALLTKRYLKKHDPMLIQALAVITVLLKSDGLMEAENILQFMRVILRKGTTEIHDFEFFKIFRSLYTRYENMRMEIEQEEEDDIPLK